ncbi:hypothetical protein [Litoribacillus peritrichatus]|uniref:DUF2007 domain-containing protein n=1 Tax=Litoribacillus peritrichatus TaxID=718191 RepID=A0ABP7MA47_9GAMM
MAKLTKSVSGGILSPREEWSLVNGIAVTAALENEECCLFVTDKNGKDYAKIVSKLLEVNGIHHNLSGTIDSFCIELPLSSKEKVINLIEKSC